MVSFINKFKIPTLLGLSIILSGIVAGVLLVLTQQVFFGQAAPNLNPQNITVSNIDESSSVISWTTQSPTTGFITFGQNNPFEQTVLDDRDKDNPKLHSTHYVSLKNLTSKTTYLFKVVSSKITSDTNRFQTATVVNSQNGFGPIIGSALDDNTPLTEGIVYLSISNSLTQSTLIKNLGNFILPIASIRDSSLSDVYKPSQEDSVKLTVISDKGQASALFKLNPQGKILPPIKLGQDIDLTSPQLSPSPSSTTSNLKVYDLNEDKLINAADYAIVLQNFGKNPKNIKADLNGDGVVDQKDLNLMQKQINQ